MSVKPCEPPNHDWILKEVTTLSFRVLCGKSMEHASAAWLWHSQYIMYKSDGLTAGICLSLCNAQASCCPVASQLGCCFSLRLIKHA